MELFEREGKVLDEDYWRGKKVRGLDENIARQYNQTTLSYRGKLNSRRLIYSESLILILDC